MDEVQESELAAWIERHAMELCQAASAILSESEKISSPRIENDPLIIFLREADHDPHLIYALAKTAMGYQYARSDLPDDLIRATKVLGALYMEGRKTRRH